MKARIWFSNQLAAALLAACVLSAAVAQPIAQERKAGRILDSANIKGGLIVHIGCGDGRLTAALRANDRYIVQGLDTDAGKVEKARETIVSEGEGQRQIYCPGAGYRCR